MDKKIPPHKETAFQEIMDKVKGTNSRAQRTRLLAALQLFPVTTFEASRYLDIYYPPSRISELRDEGNEIDLHWQNIETESGDSHRVGLYVLKAAGGQS